MEGVMMRNGGRYACTVRKGNGEIVQKTEDYRTIGGSDKLRKIPFLRGPIIFLDSMKLGMSTLAWSSSFFMEEEDKAESEAETENKNENETETPENAKSRGKSSGGEKAAIAASMAFALVFAVGLFILLPAALTRLLKNVIQSQLGVSLIEGLIRMVIFILYLILISQMKEIKRVFMYHGAEHKCINCVEHGLPLNVENVRKSSRFHKRCGTSFILFSLLVSIFVSIFLPREPLLLRVGLKLLVLPLVMSLSYEFIHLAGCSDHPLINALSKPGLWLQRITTREPQDDMIEVGIASTEAVFDWKSWQEENLGG